MPLTYILEYMYIYFTYKIAMNNTEFNKKRALFTSTLGLNLRKELVKCYTWSIYLSTVETWTLRNADQKYLEGFEMWC